MDVYMLCLYTCIIHEGGFGPLVCRIPKIVSFIKLLQIIDSSRRDELEKENLRLKLMVFLILV